MPRNDKGQFLPIQDEFTNMEGLTRQQRWKLRHPEKAIENSRQYCLENPEKKREASRKYSKDHPKRIRIYSKIQAHPERYPLDDECVFCGRTEALEHGHLDYEDNGENYLTVCHQCNCWMEKTDAPIGHH